MRRNILRKLKLKNRFVLVFGAILLLTVILGSTAIQGVNVAKDKYENIINVTEELSTELTRAQLNVFDMRRLSTLALLNYERTGKFDMSKYKETETLAVECIQTTINKIEEIKKNDIIKNIETDKLQNVVSEIQGYAKIMDKIEKKLKLNEDYGVTLKEAGKRGEKFLVDINNEWKKISKELSNYADAVTKNMNTREYIIIGIVLLVLIIGFALGISMSLSIRKPMEILKKIAIKVSNGDLSESLRTNETDEVGELSNAIEEMASTFNNILVDINLLSNELDKGNISYRINTEKYKGAFGEAIKSINLATNNLVEESTYIIEKVKEFGNGEFNAEIKDFPGDKDNIKLELTAVQKALKDVSNDINSLISNGADGNLEFRLDTTQYVGQWKDTINALNMFVETVVVPIKETQNALNQFSVGNFAHRITNEYKGEFNNIKETVNYTAETIGSYISEISDILSEMANKNLVASIDREYLGDFKQIQESVILILDNFNILTKDIITSAEQVSSGAKQISESSISLAEGATEQAGSVEHLTSIVNIISKQSGENAESSQKANDLALDAKDSANEGSKQMDTMLVAMEDINTASSEISNIIKVIDDIAFQTNILALNAAVEAARAGEDGKGFAVVAEEVRSLAGRSQQAAKETTELIERSVSKVSEGSKIANNTASALHNIVNQITEIASLVNSCAVSSKEQEKSIDEITDGIMQISQVTQSNTATSEESAAASQELASQAEVFYTSVSDFKLKD